ncbi:MAG TPA: UDP-N-acetylmuramate--L-alanine ligase [Candidatus Margulisiibacteriota bacterium]|nr:UDP-N-acetylmuramate--L-alanine ligase [Candidatus Margulisiibacteriota bacterium]
MTHYHLIGIGGIGMSGIAHLLLESGVKVSGSDLKEGAITQELKNSGAKIYLGHDAKNIQDAEVVVYSSAIKEDNPEFMEAKRRGLRLIKRAQALAELMRDKSVITVAGSHGKTTTTSLVSYMLMEAGLCPTAAIGGILKNIDTNACSGKGKFFVAEADESDGSFLYYRPKYSIITNIDREHLDYYKEFKVEIEAFREFILRTEEGGCLFCCADDANLIGLVKDYHNRYILFGLKENSGIYPKNIKFNGLASEFDCFYNGKLVSRFKLSLGGMHNISNALSVIAMGLELDIGLEVIKKTLINYKGAGRRLEVKFQDKGLTLIDDYAHHPTEIMATLSALKNFASKRTIAVFQPHRYSRTKILLDDFSASFADADNLIVTDIYPASESPIEGITAKLLCERIRSLSPGKKIDYLPKEEIVEYLLQIKKPGDLLVTLGAGDITRVCDELAKRLKGEG